jgi:cytochrome b subunit of formate dehydrogenase
MRFLDLIKQQNRMWMLDHRIREQTALIKAHVSWRRTNQTTDRIYAALWVKGTITAMVEGWVTSTWAKKHHPRWYREVRQKQEKSSE